MANYISNKEFTKAVAAYIEECDKAETEGRELPIIPNNIANQFITLATKLGSRYNFSGYTFRDEMVSSAIFACCAKVRKFNINVSENAFAYFTNVCWRAMVDVINAEEKMSYIKAKAYQGVDFSEMLAENDISDAGEHTNQATDFIPYFDIEDYEKRKDIGRPRAKSKKSTEAENTLDV